jgi:sepiapterin reductase
MSAQQPPLVWITGASSGIGRALAHEFVAHGSSVILSSRTESSLESFRKAADSQQGTVHFVPCDVRKELSVNAAAQKILETIGIPDVLVNNAGVTVFKTFAETTLTDFDDIIDTNLRGSFLTTKAVLNGMTGRGSGIIMNVVSFAAKTTYTDSSAYTASKSGLAAMMDGLRAEVREKGIKIVNVFPGAVLTPIWHPNVRAKHGSKMLTPEDAAKMIYSVFCQPAGMMVEEIVLRPQSGDINE